MLRMSAQLSRWYALQDAGNQHIAHGSEMGHTIFILLIRQLERFRHANDKGSIVRSRAEAAFMTAACLYAGQFYSFPDVENANPFGSVKLMRRQTQHIDAQLRYIKCQLSARLNCIGV